MKNFFRKALILSLTLILALSVLPVLGESYETLEKGSKGDAVSALQAKLLLLGYLQDVPDGAYGNGTAAAVKAFQTENGLEPTGVADPATQEAMFAIETGELPEVFVYDIELVRTDEFGDRTYRLKIYNGTEYSVAPEYINYTDSPNFEYVVFTGTSDLISSHGKATTGDMMFLSAEAETVWISVAQYRTTKDGSYIGIDPFAEPSEFVWIPFSLTE